MSGWGVTAGILEEANLVGYVLGGASSERGDGGDPEGVATEKAVTSSVGKG